MPLPELLPWASYDDALEDLLRTTCTAAGNARTGGGAHRERVERYLTFCADSVTRLRHVLRPVSIDALLLTRRYWAVLGLDPVSRAAGGLVDLELFDCEARLSAAVFEIQQERRRWQDAGELVVPDTNVLLHSLDKAASIESAPWRAMAEVRPMEPLTLVLLLTVVDELDRKKRTNDRTIARQRLKEVNSAIGSGLTTLVAPSTVSSGSMHLTVLVDDPDHVRLPHPDSEIIDQVLSLTQRTPWPVHLVTGDAGMVVRARQLGVLCHHVPTP